MVIVVLLVLTEIALTGASKLHIRERFQIGHCHWRQVTDAVRNSPQEPDSYES